ncbi:MAG: methyl-accepting chemotaxis protein [Deltaproteobacteria bacterium]|nr:methyl-accepting chemotaxis protein [Deltaproteobacteria bacterium]
MVSKVAYRRRQYLIKKQLQGKFIFFFSCAVVAIFLLHWFMVYYIIDKELSIELYKSHMKIRSTGEMIGPILWYLSAATIPVVIVIGSVVGYLLLRKIELPLSSIKEVVEAIKAGDFTRRMPSDIPEDLPRVFNDMTEDLEETFRALHGNIEGLQLDIKKIDNLTEGDSSNLHREIQRMIEEITKKRKAIEEKLLRYKIEP